MLESGLISCRKDKIPCLLEGGKENKLSRVNDQDKG